jgi:hypothetical protein
VQSARNQEITMPKTKATMDSVTLTNHLRVAADRYARDVQNLTNEQPVAMAWAIEQFREQQAQCEQMADALEDGSMSIDGDLLVVR